MSGNKNERTLSDRAVNVRFCSQNRVSPQIDPTPAVWNTVLMTASPLPAGALSFRAAALTTGFGLLLMTLCAPPAFFILLPQGVVPEDAAATLEALRGPGGSPYLLGALLLFATYCLDLIVTWGLYWLFRPA